MASCLLTICRRPCGQLKSAAVNDRGNSSQLNGAILPEKDGASMKGFRKVMLVGAFVLATGRSMAKKATQFNGMNDLEGEEFGQTRTTMWRHTASSKSHLSTMPAFKRPWMISRRLPQKMGHHAFA